jgi:hypothetical protein
VLKAKCEKVPKEKCAKMRLTNLKDKMGMGMGFECE